MSPIVLFTFFLLTQYNFRTNNNLSESEEIIIFVDDESDVSANNISEDDFNTNDENIEKIVLDDIKIENNHLSEDAQFIYIDGEFMEVTAMDNVDDNKKKKRTQFGSNLELCNMCGKLIKEKNMPAHYAMHGRKECEVCNKTFDTFNELTEHRSEHLGEEFPCDTCDESFNDLFDFVVHNYKHTNIYSCLVCNFTTSSKSSIKGHIRRHEGKYTHYCDICGKGFLGKALLKSHEEMHLDIKRYSCEICNKKFSVKRYLHIHKSLNHKKELFGIEEFFQCEICGRDFTFEKSLKRHQSVIHHIGEDRTVECPICHKIIANNYNLKMHMRVHTRETKYCCDLCGKAFTAYKYWKKHTLAHDRQKTNNEMVLDTNDEDTLIFNLDDVDEIDLDNNHFIVDFGELD